MLLRNDFQDNRNIAVLSHPSRRYNKPSDYVVGSKTTGSPKDTMTDMPVRINSLSVYLRCYVEDFMLLEDHQDIIILSPQKGDIYQEYTSHETILIGNAIFNKYYAKIVLSPYDIAAAITANNECQ